MKRESWPVTEGDTCPAGEPGRCCYCCVPIGQEHIPECVIRERTVVISATFEVVWRVPEGWTDEDIEFRLNESSMCADNMIDDLNVLRSQASANGDCLCSKFKAEYVREASEADEESCHNRIKDEPPGFLDQSEWVSVKDELPSEEGLHLVYLPGCEPDAIRLAWFRRDVARFRLAVGEPSHWMPLPEPPR